MRTQAVIIRKQRTGEYDQLVTCYTKEFGKLTAVAKSSLRPGSTQGMQLDVLNLVDFELINGRATPIIAAAQTENGYAGLRASLTALAAAYFFLEVFHAVVFDHEKDERLWDFLISTLDDLQKNAAGGPLLPLFRQKQSECLNVLGYKQRLPSGQAMPAHSPADAVFERLAGRRFSSLTFLYSLLNSSYAATA